MPELPENWTNWTSNADMQPVNANDVPLQTHDRPHSKLQHSAGRCLAGKWLRLQIEIHYPAQLCTACPKASRTETIVVIVPAKDFEASLAPRLDTILLPALADRLFPSAMLEAG